MKVKVVNKILVRRFKIVEVMPDGIVLTHIMRGTQEQIDIRINYCKSFYEDCQFFGKEGMVVWGKRA